MTKSTTTPKSKKKAAKKTTVKKTATKKATAKKTTTKKTAKKKTVSKKKVAKKAVSKTAKSTVTAKDPNATTQLKTIEQVAFEIYQNRLDQNLPGDATSDWFEAVELMKKAES